MPLRVVLRPKSIALDAVLVAAAIVGANLLFDRAHPGWANLNPSPYLLLPILLGGRYGWVPPPRSIAAEIIGSILGGSSSAGADWGTVRGRFVLDGSVPERPVLQINKDVEFCGKHQPRSEQLVVHAQDRGIANVVVWLDVKPGEKVAVHESLTKEVPALLALVYLALWLKRRLFAPEAPVALAVRAQS